MSLYLKYRPQDFSGLVGQDFVKETLQSAIRQNKLVWAYLFTWPRGTGKTSSARIFAKTINCLHPKDGNPCMQCEICQAFSENKLIDIIEIDAASYTGVDNIRDIIEKAQFTPNKAKYKVYIIDEVHMLSKGAFNALLKILEEPPEHVKFILATTEVNKVPETILSRCQRYDFKNIDDESIKKRLLYIAKEENIKTEEKALNYIVKNASGGLRNAINLFEQMVVENALLYETIHENLGVSDEETFENFLEKLLQKDKSIIDDCDTLTVSGKNLRLFLKDLIFYIKDRIVEKLKKDENYSDELIILEILDETHNKLKSSLDEKITFFAAILKLISSEQKKELPQIKEEKKQEEKPKQIKQEKKEEKETLKEEDITSIFWWEEEKSVSPKKNSSSQEAMKSNAWDFKKTLIDTLKTLGAKGVIILSIQGVSISLSDEILLLSFDKKMPYNSINNPSSISLIQQALDSLWKSDVKIEIRLIS